LFRYNNARSADRRVFAQSLPFDWGGSDADFGTGHLEPHGRSLHRTDGDWSSPHPIGIGAKDAIEHDIDDSRFSTEAV
jgi:hypothetical protein